jgi:hypothetical protein
MNNAGYNQYKQAKPSIHRRPLFIAATWVAGLLSVGLVYISGKILSVDLSAFRSCADNNGLALANCGKRGLNMGDLALLGLFIACAALMMSLFTAALRMSRRAK